MHFYKLLPLLKPMEGKIPESVMKENKEFYQENEWRFVPEVNNFFWFAEEYYKKKDEEDLKIQENYTLEFEPEDIRYIFIDNEGEIPSLVEFINGKLKKYDTDRLQILQTRIISLETLNTDL